MKKRILMLLLPTSIALADTDNGFYLGAGLGAGVLDVNTSSMSNYKDNTTYRFFAGYQIWSFLGAELGYTHMAPTSFSNVNSLATQVFDASITPGIEIPLTPVTIYGRLGYAAINASSSNNALQTSGTTYAGEWGAGVKVGIPFTGVFIRGEYINYGNMQNLTSPNGTFNGGNVSPSAFLLSGGYVF